MGEYSAAPWPHFESDEIEAVAGVLASGKVNYWTGQNGKSFEREFGDYVGVSGAVLVANGTLALELALRALDLPPGSEVITTPRSFFATVSSIVAVGLRPVFADVDRDSGNITPESVRAVMTDKTSAVVVVHLGGWPADMAGLRELADECGLGLIEDCAQAHGAKIGGQSVGSFGDIAAWSFCTDKIMSTGGEGGMVTTDREDLRRRMWSYKDHGKDWDEVHRKDHPPGFRWLHTTFGSNWRATEMQAAIGRRQLAKLPDWQATRQRNAEVLAKGLAQSPVLRVPLPGEEIQHAYYRQYAYLLPDALRPGWDQQRFIGEVGSRGVPIFSGSCSEMYRERALELLPGFEAPSLPSAAELMSTSLAFLVHPGLTVSDMELVASTVADVAREAMA